MRHCAEVRFGVSRCVVLVPKDRIRQLRVPGLFSRPDTGWLSGGAGEATQPYSAGFIGRIKL